MSTYQVLPNYTKVSGGNSNGRGSSLTFSKPKNLSLPSVLFGPTSFASSFSRGVGCGALGSFFAGVLFAEAPAVFCMRKPPSAPSPLCTKSTVTHSYAFQ